MVKYLVGRFADPLLGVASGVWAYHLYETDERNAAERPPGRRLHELLRARWYHQGGPSSSAAAAAARGDGGGGGLKAQAASPDVKAAAMAGPEQGKLV